jgi:O-antigen ligase
MTELASSATPTAFPERRVAAVALAVAGVYAAAIVDTGGSVLLLAPLVAAILVLAIFAHPVIGLYVLFGAALLFEQFAVKGLTPITQYARVFQNLSAYTPIPIRLSMVDLLVLLTFASLLAQRLRAKHEPLRMGAFGWPVLAYVSVFVIGTVIGAARGDSWKPEIALVELRGPFQLCLLYFLAVNLIRERRQLSVFMWVFVAFVGIKALQGILNYFEARSLPYYVEGVTNHEDVVFFAVAVAITVIAVVLRVRTRLTYALIALLPIFLAVEVLSQRRSGVVALGVVLVAMTLLTLATHPRRGMALVGIGALGVAAYATIFWEATGPMAEPVRALRSVFEPSATSLIDQSSNAWRELEARNIAFTVRQLPLTGVGVGQAYLFQQEPSTLFGFLYWRYITHNAILWLWLKAGPIGAIALWFLIARALLIGSALYMRLRDNELRVVVTLPIALVVSQVIFSSVDLGLTYSRTMIVLGTSLGMTAMLAASHPPGRQAIAVGRST